MNEENKKSSAATEDFKNISMIGIQVDPKEFAEILANAPVVSEIGEPEEIKHDCYLSNPGAFSRLMYRIESLEREVRLLKNEPIQEDLEYYSNINDLIEAVHKATND